MGNQIEDVPDISAEWYREITAFALHTPGWVRDAAAVATDAVPVILFALLVFGWWRARRGDDRTMALALLAPVAVVTAYLASEGVKSVLRLHRPCWDLTDVVTVATCPPYGDWSLPSNHATFAAAAAVGPAVLWRGVVAVVAPVLALLEAFSRVFVGVHYPHDVAAGLLLGALVAPVVLPALRSPATALISAMRRRPALAVLVATGRPPPGRTRAGCGRWRGRTGT
ncbi:phosphatase PAP2 family protein [Microbispora hainanensis]|uniref:phosphatase PAP2 family protein n=1 Tax=Microbispora TaxID=2005 RepID=UPI00115A9B11|nr:MULTISPECIES: phosphatase PAP2 family protein [Microbispora]NJP26995.1 phosphatase PAP2 family protein [Microbispora sp. CL1-1]TQS11642.1 phosphatase PAP2 family protein [Microbispora sp. SCL1-1]